MDRDGKNNRQVTTLSAASFAPSWHPDMKRLIFATNVKDPQQRNFDIFLINLDGTGLEQVTFNQHLRRLPDVLAGRQARGVRVEPEREELKGKRTSLSPSG